MQNRYLEDTGNISKENVQTSASTGCIFHDYKTPELDFVLHTLACTSMLDLTRLFAQIVNLI